MLPQISAVFISSSSLENCIALKAAPPCTWKSIYEGMHHAPGNQFMKVCILVIQPLRMC